MKNSIFLITLLFITLTASTTGAQTEPVCYDIIINLDDRILDQNQIERDQEIIKIVFNDFEKLVKQKRFYINSEDVFRVLITPQKGSPPEIANISGELMIDLGQKKFSEKRKDLDQFSDELNDKLERLYKTAFTGDQSNDYNGANIWRYLNGLYMDEFKEDMNHKIFFLTDGYIDFEKEEAKVQDKTRYSNTEFISSLYNKGDWESIMESKDLGLIPSPLTLEDSEVWILEINPKTDSYYEGQILKEVYEKWFKEMGADEVRTILKTTNIPKSALISS